MSPQRLPRVLTRLLPSFKKYLLAAGSVSLAFQLNRFIAPYVSVLPPFLAFLAAVMVTAWYGGMLPGSTIGGCTNESKAGAARAQRFS